MPIGSHHDVSISTVGSERLHAIINTESPLAALTCLTPPGPAVLTSSIAHCAPPALVAKALLPSMMYPPSTFSTVVPKRACSPGLRACGSPLHATHFSPRSTTPLNQRAFCSSVAMPSSSTSELTWPSQQRASERSTRAISFVIIHNVKTSPAYGPSPKPPCSFGTTGACRPARKRSSKSWDGNAASRSYSAARGAKFSRASTLTRLISSCCSVLRSSWLYTSLFDSVVIIVTIYGL